MKTLIDINAIKEILPHRYPFLLVDKIVDMVPEKSITGIKNVTINESFFQGHFPGQPIMPGVLIVEALAQTSGVLALQDGGRKGKIVYFAAITNAKFRKPVVPGDTLFLEIEVINFRSRIIKCRGVAKVDGQVVAEAEMLFSVMGEKK